MLSKEFFSTRKNFLSTSLTALARQDELDKLEGPKYAARRAELRREARTRDRQAAAASQDEADESDASVQCVEPPPRATCASRAGVRLYLGLCFQPLIRNAVKTSGTFVKELQTYTVCPNDACESRESSHDATQVPLPRCHPNEARPRPTHPQYT